MKRNIALIVLTILMISFIVQAGDRVRWDTLTEMWHTTTWRSGNVVVTDGTNTSTIKPDSVITTTASVDTLAVGYTLVQTVTQTDTVKAYTDPQVTFTEDVVIDSTLSVQGPTGTGTATAGILTLATKELTIVDGDELGRINFNAPLESDGGDAILAGAAIWAEADDTFSATVNSTELVFGTATTSAAVERMRIDSAGNVGIGTAGPGYELDLVKSEVGGEVSFRIYNSDNTNSASDARNYLQVGGASAGDPTQAFTVVGATDWILGIDNSDSDKFKIGAGVLGTADKLIIQTDGDVGIGTVTPDRLFHSEKTSALTNAVQQVARLSHITSGTPANGIGLGLEFEQETSAANNEIIGTIEAVVTDTTSTSEDAYLAFKVMVAGAAAAERARVDLNGLTLPDPGTSANSYTITLQGDNAGTVQSGTIQVLYGADPYMRLSAPADAGAATAILDLKDQKIVIGGGGAGVDYIIEVNGETNDGTITYMEDEDRFDFDNAVDVIGALTASTVTSDGVITGAGDITTSDGAMASAVETVGTLGVGATTFVIDSNFCIVTGDAGGNTVGTITGGVAGQTLILLFTDALVTITNTDAHTANTVDLSAAFTSADDTTLTLMFDGTSWYEVSRSVN